GFGKAGGGGTFQFRAIAGANEEAFFDAGVPTGFQINQLVANHVTVEKVEMIFIAGVVKTLRRWFPSAAWLIRRFGCDVDFFKAHAALSENTAEMLVDAFDVREREVAAANAGLVGN